MGPLGSNQEIDIKAKDEQKCGPITYPDRSVERLKRNPAMAVRTISGSAAILPIRRITNIFIASFAASDFIVDMSIGYHNDVTDIFSCIGTGDPDAIF